MLWQLLSELMDQLEREIEIVEVVHQGTQVAEFCEGPDASFQNLLFVGADTGRIWRSLQWLGPDQGSIDVEIIEPFEPDSGD